MLKTGSLLAAAAAVASILALTACDGNGSTGSGGATGTSGGSPAAPTSATGQAGQAGAGGSQAGGTEGSQTVAQRTAKCNVRQLRISYTDNKQVNQGALDGMSKTDNVVTFVSLSHSTCVIQGYPGVAALNGHGLQVGQARRSGERVHPVYLRPGGVASALVSANTASCDTPSRVAGLLVTAPDQYSSTRLGSPGEMCLGSLTVHPIVPGSAAGFVF